MLAGDHYGPGLRYSLCIPVPLIGWKTSARHFQGLHPQQVYFTMTTATTLAPQCAAGVFVP